MHRALLTYHLLLFVVVVATAQINYSLAGKVDACYDAGHTESISLVNLKLHSLDTGKEYAAAADNAGYFKFKGLPVGNYRLSAAALGFPDNNIVIIVNADIQY